jgi:hypothetical protein
MRRRLYPPPYALSASANPTAFHRMLPRLPPVRRHIDHKHRAGIRGDASITTARFNAALVWFPELARRGRMAREMLPARPQIHHRNREAINNDEARKAEKLKKAELVGSPLRT